MTENFVLRYISFFQKFLELWQFKRSLNAVQTHLFKFEYFCVWHSLRGFERVNWFPWGTNTPCRGFRHGVLSLAGLRGAEVRVGIASTRYMVSQIFRLRNFFRPSSNIKYCGELIRKKLTKLVCEISTWVVQIYYVYRLFDARSPATSSYRRRIFIWIENEKQRDRNERDQIGRRSRWRSRSGRKFRYGCVMVEEIPANCTPCVLLLLF